MPSDPMADLYEMMAAKQARGQGPDMASLDEGMRANMGQADSDQFIGFDKLLPKRGYGSQEKRLRQGGAPKPKRSYVQEIEAAWAKHKIKSLHDLKKRLQDNMMYMDQTGSPVVQGLVPWTKVRGLYDQMGIPIDNVNRAPQGLNPNALTPEDWSLVQSMAPREE